MRHAGTWLALAALSVFPFSVDNFELPHLVVLAFGAVALSYRSRAVPRALVVALALVVGAATLTTLWSSAPAFSFPGLITLLVLAGFALVSGGLSWKPVLWTTWPIAAWAFAQALGLDPIEWGDAARWCGGLRPFSTLGHPTQLGVWMALVCVLAVDEAWARRSWAMGLTAVVAGITCGVTLSRAGWLALGVGLLVWGWLQRPRLSRGSIALGLGGLGGVVLLAKGPAVLERLTHFFVAPTRVHLWGTSLAGFTHHPWLGWGFDAFALVDQQLRHPEAWRYEWGGTAGHAHSLVPQLLATQGALGVFAALAAVVVVLRAWKAQRPEPGVAAVVVALGAASMVTFAGVAVTALGLLALAQSLRAAPSRQTRQWFPIPLLGLAGVTLLMFGGSVAARLAPEDSMAARLEPWNAQWPARQGEVMERSGKLAEALTAYEHAGALVPLAVFEANVGRVAARSGEVARSRTAFERARRLAPLDGRIALDAAEASLHVGDVRVAEGTLTSLVTLYPSDGPAWLALARLRAQTNRVLEARAALEQAIAADWRDWPEGLGVARSSLAQLLTQTGESQRAMKVAVGPSVFALPGDACGAPSVLGGAAR